MTYANRIIDTGQIDPRDIIKNSKNWRKHPDNQIDAMAGVLDDIGWIQDVTILTKGGYRSQRDFDIAALDGIEPPTGEALQQVLDSMGLCVGPAQILRW